MNRSLRRWHFRLIAGLAPVALAVLAAAVVARRSPPINATPAPLQSAATEAREVRRTVIRGNGLAVELRHLVSSTGGILEVYPLSEQRVADLLLYTGPEGLDSLPGDAQLLGAVTGAPGQRFTLPVSAENLELYWYSGATRALVAHTALFEQEGPIR